MKSSENNHGGGGVTSVGMLGVAFVVLKLCNVIDWSWWYVTLPFWGGFALLAAVAAVMWSVAMLSTMWRSS